MEELRNPEVIAKFEQGPVGILNVIPSGPPTMAKNLVQWFAFCVLTSIFVAYVASFSMEPGWAYLDVFRLTGTVAIVTYATSNFQEAIWKGGSWGTALKCVFDGLIYGLVTAGIFSWL
ncbi:MAG: hypothetical protein ACYTG5_23105 [Planctomycetota bacterium]|jgi:hypothetical protein